MRPGVIRGSTWASLHEVSGDEESPGPWVESWLSRPRFAVYLAAAGANRRLALDLYEWNATVSAALLHDLAHLEVALRNAYDAAIVANTSSSVPHWTADPYRLFPVRWRSGPRRNSHRCKS